MRFSDLRARIALRCKGDESSEAQVRACTEYIQKQKGWVLVGEYIDRAFSARSDQRPEFQRMIEDAKKHKFDAIVIHKLDRFSRDRYDHAFYKRELKHAGVTLYSVLENLEFSRKRNIRVRARGVTSITAKILAAR